VYRHKLQILGSLTPSLYGVVFTDVYLIDYY